MEKSPFSVRQGDVLIVEASYRGGIPKDATKVAEEGDVILAHGEVTGHAHRIAKSLHVDYFDHAAERFLRVVCDSPLTHEEHTAIPILPREGGYQQAFQAEEFGEEVRRVQD